MRAPKPAPPDFLAATLAHIEAHLFEDLSVSALADAVGLSPWHFSRAFTARLGESVMGYVRARRLEAGVRDHALLRLGPEPATLELPAVHDVADEI